MCEQPDRQRRRREKVKTYSGRWRCWSVAGSFQSSQVKSSQVKSSQVKSDLVLGCWPPENIQKAAIWETDGLTDETEAGALMVTDCI